MNLSTNLSMKKTNIIFTITLILILGITAGCIKIRVGTPDGGVFKSVDGTASWQQKAALLSLNREQNTLTRSDVTALVFDPQDSGTLYLGTKEDGIFVTFDAAESWQKITRLPGGKINSIDIHPRAKHIVYVAIGNRIFKSLDCCRTWQNVYLEAAPQVEITVLTIDPTNGARVYAGLSDGRIIMSEDNGSSWLTIVNLRGRIKQILINPKNSNILYATTHGRGLWRSNNQGTDWQSLDENLKDFPGGPEVGKLIFNPLRSDGLISASDYGLLRTDDGGQTWVDYKLLVPRGRVKIYSFTVNPKNPDILYYVTTTTLYKSDDGGRTWTTKSMPAKRAPVELLIDFANPNILYLGVAKIEDK